MNGALMKLPYPTNDVCLMTGAATEAAADASFVGGAPPVASLPSPTRQVDQKILISLIRARQVGEAVTVDYRSMTSFDEPSIRTIFPTSFAEDGFRWHVRAFCFRSGMFKDFVLGRINSLLGSAPPPYPVPADLDWDTFVDVVIGANPSYPLEKRQAIEHDYQMIDGEARFRARSAQLYYLKRRLGLNQQSGAVVPDHQQIVLLRIDPVIQESQTDE